MPPLKSDSEEEEAARVVDGKLKGSSVSNVSSKQLTQFVELIV